MKNKVISLFLAATMVLSLCPATVRAQTVPEEFSLPKRILHRQRKFRNKQKFRKKQKLSVRGKMKKHPFRRQQKKKQKPPGIPGRKTKN